MHVRHLIIAVLHLPKHDSPNGGAGSTDQYVDALSIEQLVNVPGLAVTVRWLAPLSPGELT